MEAFEADADQRVLVITGDGSFSSGADLHAASELLARDKAGASSPMGFTRMEASKPTIAAIEGHCYAGGLEMACWCDFRIAGSDADFGVENRRWGVPQASLRADRTSAIRDDGLEVERVRGEATLGDPDMSDGLRRFLSGDRQTPPTASGA